MFGPTGPVATVGRTETQSEGDTDSYTNCQLTDGHPQRSAQADADR